MKILMIIAMLFGFTANTMAEIAPDNNLTGLTITPEVAVPCENWIGLQDDGNGNYSIPENPKVFFGAPAVPEKTETMLGMVDLSSILGNLRASVLINRQAELFYGAHIPVITFIGKKNKVEYININAGIVYSSDKKKSDFMMSLGIRLDSYLSKFGKSYPNVQTANLPAIEIGPFLSYGFNNWMYGAMLSIRLGK